MKGDTPYPWGALWSIRYVPDKAEARVNSGMSEKCKVILNFLLHNL
jgi:hypothetical protein